MDWKTKSKNPGHTTEPCWHERSHSLLSNAWSELSYLRSMQCSVGIVFTSVVFAWHIATRTISRGKSPGIMVFGVDICLTCLKKIAKQPGKPPPSDSNLRATIFSSYMIASTESAYSTEIRAIVCTLKSPCLFDGIDMIHPKNPNGHAW